MQTPTAHTALEPRNDTTLLPQGRRRRVLRALWVLLVLNALVVFAWLVYFTFQFSNNLPGRITTGLQEMGWTPALYLGFHAGFMLLGFGVYLATGLLIYLVRPHDRMAWFASIVLIAFGAENSYPLATEFANMWGTAPLLFRIPYFINNLCSWGFLIAFLVIFPDGRFVPGWSRWVALFCFLFSMLFGLFPAAVAAPDNLLGIIIFAGALFMFGGTLTAQVWRYRHYATPLQKQQTKWLIYALSIIVLLTIVLTQLLYVVAPAVDLDAARGVQLDLFFFLAFFCILLLPIAIAIAILRYRLWDIDIIIRKTVTYALVVGLLGLVYFVVVLLLQRSFAIFSGQESEIVTVISTLAIAALFIPVRNLVQSAVDRRFYRKKYDAQQVLAAFAATVRDETDLDKLTAALVQVVNDTMQPRSSSLWLTGSEDNRRSASK